MDTRIVAKAVDCRDCELCEMFNPRGDEPSDTGCRYPGYEGYENPFMPSCDGRLFQPKRKGRSR